jgi:putative resolvase
VTPKTIRNWDRIEKIKTVRTQGGHRRIPLSEIESILGTNENKKQVTLVYCRVSTKKQEENLERQIGRVLQFCVENKWNTELFKDVGSGLNENRNGFHKLMKRIPQGDVTRIVVEYKDRVTRYGFETFKSFCESHGVSVYVMNDNVKKEFEEELVEDMISLITSYSARIYGKRGGRKKK